MAAITLGAIIGEGLMERHLENVGPIKLGIFTLKFAHAAETTKTSGPVEVWDCGPNTADDNHNYSYHIGDDGQLYDDGTMWDFCTLVNPQIEGERVYIPEDLLSESQRVEGKDHWFYKDTCRLITAPVYTLRTSGRGKYDVYSYDRKDHMREVRKEDPREYDKQFFLVAPKIEGRRIILENYTEDGRVYFIPRADLVWVNPPIKVSTSPS